MPSLIPLVPSFLATDQHSQFIVEQANDAIFVYDLEGHFVDANPAAYHLVGFSREELLRLTVSDIELSFDFEQGPKRWREMRVGEAVTLEGVNRRKDGSIFPSEARISVVETKEGRLLLALVRDVSERQRAEKLLLLRAQQQQGIAELGADALSGKELGALSHDALRLVSQTLHLELCRVLEHVPERKEFIVRAGLNLRAGEMGTRAASDGTEYVAGHVLHSGEPAVIRNYEEEPRFQRTPWLEAEHALCGMTVPVGSSAPRYGVLAGYSRELRDFTADDVYFVQAVANVLAAAIARRRGEDALREVEARYQRIAANTPGVVYQFLQRADGTLAVPFISESCRTLYGLESHEIRANPQFMLESVHPEDRTGFLEAMHTAKDRLTPLHWQGRHLLPGGEVRWMRVDSRPERLPDGGVICDGIIIDITEEEERKQALQRGEERLRLAKEEAERANAAKSKFLSRMSHELRTPLNAILGFGQILELSPYDDSDEQCIQHILRGGRHLLSLIDEVLDLARVEAGELALTLTTTSFGKLMQESTGFVSKMAQARKITCTAKLGPACRLPIWVDERRLRQVLLNLLSNAIKYDREGGRVTLSCQQMPDGRVRCSVEDTGPGISPEGLARLFVPFERLGQELTDTQGLGLGLVVSRRLAEAMDGSVGAESQLGLGSTFWVELPAAAQDSGPTGSPDAMVGLTPEEPGSGTATVLYVEDNLSNQQVMKTVVQRLRPHWRFLLAADGVSGLQMAREQRPDVVLLDLELPGMKGDALLAALRAEAPTSQLPVLLLSADATTQSRERLLALGANDFVSKPYNVADLLKKIDGLFRSPA